MIDINTIYIYIHMSSQVSYSSMEYFMQIIYDGAGNLQYVHEETMYERVFPTEILWVKSAVDTWLVEQLVWRMR